MTQRNTSKKVISSSINTFYFLGMLFFSKGFQHIYICIDWCVKSVISITIPGNSCFNQHQRTFLSFENHTISNPNLWWQTNFQRNNMYDKPSWFRFCMKYWEMLALKMCRGPSLVQAETGWDKYASTAMKHWNGKTVIASIVLRAEMRAARLQAQILTPIPSTGFMYNPHMGRLKNLTCFEVFCLISIGAFSSNTALRNCFGTLFSEIPLRQELLFRNSANEGVNILACN